MRSGPHRGIATADDHTRALAGELRLRLVDRRRAEAASGGPAGALEHAVRELVDEAAIVLSAARREQIVDLILRDTVGLGPLEELLADDEVEEVMVNGHESVYVERRGRIERTEVRFESEQALRDAIERILAPVGRRVDELSPMADARLADGSRVNVVIPPLAVDGPGALGAPVHGRAAGPRRAGRLGHAHPRASRPAPRRRWPRAAASWSRAAPGRGRRRC